MLKIKRGAAKQLSTAFLIFNFSFYFAACKGYRRNSTHKDVPLSSIEKGEALAKLYCQSCHQFPAAIGRWISMDAGDINGDGKTDLILGNFSIAPTMMKHKIDWKNSPPFVILKNIGK